ncbi:MAG: 2-C-methyl-D-erythritol 2,4-cyclodiphosphate synthase [Planctomycetota bacterium]|nr:2-C-methyl-D-erythritol 2,4-cyclodiphosphate synthase [Planctomycetota bacterium]
MKAPRIGLGYDCHRLEVGGDCYIGGVLFDSELAPVGHSDADVLLHAICDAILGAAGLDDLGTVFKDNDEQWRDCSSSVFVEYCMKQITEKHLDLASLDCVVICDNPKISPMRSAIRQRLSELTGLQMDRINVKGKTTEGGDAMVITAQAVTLLVESEL